MSPVVQFALTYNKLKNLLTVSTRVSLLMTYTRFASGHLAPGLGRLLALLPIIFILPFFPCLFTTIHLRGIAPFFLTWLAVFKLLLLCFGHGPLSPSLPLSTFISIASLPVKTTCPSDVRTTTGFFSSAVRAVILAALISVYDYRDQINIYLLLVLFCLHIYLALELILGIAAGVARTFLGLELEPQFNQPYYSSSLQDFWGHRYEPHRIPKLRAGNQAHLIGTSLSTVDSEVQIGALDSGAELMCSVSHILHRGTGWNLMVTGILRPSVYFPVCAIFGFDAGVMATFLVSGIMHEVIFWYFTCAPPTGKVLWFFVLHGVCTAAEVKEKRAGWRPNKKVAGPAAVGFVIVSTFWLFFPPMLR